MIYKKLYITLFICIIFLDAVFSQSNSITFNNTSSSQTWTVPSCVTSIDISMAGGSGGGSNGGLGSLISGTLTVTPGQILQINVGGAGGCPTAGYNGGAVGASANNFSNGGCGGGGASDIRTAPFQLTDRLVVASGGGGMGGGNTDAQGGNGGCGTGGTGNSPYGVGGAGADQSSGGAGGPPWILSGNYGSNGTLGSGGSGASDPCYNYGPGGGGGGGYYGGGGGGSDCYPNTPLGGGGGGGGSSLTPTGFTCNSGNNSGDGYIIITYTSSSTTGSSSVSSCDDYVWDGVTYTTSGTYTNIYTNSVGCDSTHNLNLTINNSTSGSTTVTACDNYIWDGLTYTTSGVYTNLYTSISGCDSVHTLNLIVNNSINGSTTAISCDDYTWLANGVNYSSSGIYIDTIVNSGCTTIDELVTYQSNNSTSDAASLTGVLGGSTIKWADMITAYQNFQNTGVVVFANGNDYNSANASLQPGLPVVATELADAWLTVGNLNINGHLLNK